MKATFWNSAYSVNPPPTDGMISSAEKQLGVKLPPLFIELLKLQNGGYTTGFAFPMTIPTSWADDHVPLSELNGIATNPDSDTLHNIMLSTYMTQEWGLPEKQILLSGDGHY